MEEAEQLLNALASIVRESVGATGILPGAWDVSRIGFEFEIGQDQTIERHGSVR